MLVGICGTICAGKTSVSNFLTLQYGFRQLTVDKNVTTSTRGPTSDSLLRYEENHQQTAKDEYSFVDVQELLDFVTLRWRELWVTTSLSDETVLEILSRRPFFLLISVDAPLCTRWERYRAHCVGKGTTPPSIDQFVICHDEQLYSQTVGIAPLLHRAQLRLLNSSPSLEHLHAALRIIDIPNESRLRPNWDLYFMQLAALAAQRSNCMKRRVGCVLVRERKVVSTGYNGTPRGITNCNEGGCLRCNAAEQSGMGLQTCLCIHAEENALLEAGRDRIRDGATLYCNTCPCLTCSIKITQVGISEVVYNLGYSMDVETAAILKEGGVRLRQFSPVMEGLIDLRAILTTALPKRPKENGSNRQSP